MSLRVQAIGPDGFGAYELSAGTLTPALGAAEHIYVPGFVDVHIHGAFGIDFMSASTSELEVLCSKLGECGYESFLPTTVTAEADAVAAALAKLPDSPMIVGFHLEGPFISPEFPGAQPKERIAIPPVKPTAWEPILRDPRLKIVTLAPEVENGLTMTQWLAERGVRVGIGHTAATFAQARLGFRAGASHTTHTFNAMRPFHHRDAGAVGFALCEDRLAAELIYDRIHVCRDAAGLLYKCKPEDKVIAVSDGTAAAGMPDGSKLDMWGQEVFVADGAVRLAGGTLAGSAITLLDAFRNLAADFGIESAIRATSLNPRKLLGLGEPKIHHLFDRNMELVERFATQA